MNKPLKLTDKKKTILKSLWIRTITAIATMIILIIEFGFPQSILPQWLINSLEVTGALIYLAANIYNWFFEEREEFNWRKPLLDISLLALMLISFLILPLMIDNLPAGHIDWRVFKLYLFVVFSFHLVRLTVTAAASGVAPTRALLITFLIIIFTGSCLLMLPASSTSHDRLSITDAVFTTTSAVCVTGLTVKDTGGDFTRFGQVIILVLIQVGGLGIMIFGALFAIMLGSRLSLRETVAMRDIMQEEGHGQIGRIAVFICGSTFLLEAIGAIGLYGIWQTDAQRGNQFFQSIFHSVSAFCNAGFGLHASNLTPYRDEWRMYSFICPLIILGGLGFPVLHNIWEVLISRIKRWRGRRKVGVVRLTLHSRIVLITTLFLLLFGWEMMIILEKIRPLPPGEIVQETTALDNLFNSITARTAGFNTVNMADLSAGAKLVMIMLMFVGGSPCSTAGGIKTITAAVMVLSMFATISGRQRVNVFHRGLPTMVIRRASTVFFLYGMLVWIIVVLLTITRQGYSYNLIDILFETTSALGTVGLSTGLTTQLSIAGKWILIIAMIIGRLGPMSLLAALTMRTEREDYEYPMEPLVVG